MARHNVTKLLPLTSQTKTDSNLNLSQTKIIALPVCWFSCTRLRKRQRQEIDYLSLKESFCGVCIRKRG